MTKDWGTSGTSGTAVWARALALALMTHGTDCRPGAVRGTLTWKLASPSYLPAEICCAGMGMMRTCGPVMEMPLGQVGVNVTMRFWFCTPAAGWAALLGV